MFRLFIVFCLFKILSCHVIIDTDPGADDAWAIHMMLASGYKVLGITSVRGNTELDNVIQNILKTLGTSGYEAPVYKGYPIGWSGYIPTGDYFGVDGFGDFVYNDTMNWSLLQNKHSDEFMIEMVKKYPGKVTIVAIGPLTNIAYARKKYPHFFKDLRRIIILGGTINPGPNIEFNVQMDPLAAKFVYDHIEEIDDKTVLPYETTFSSNSSYSLEYRIENLGRINAPFVHLLNGAERISLPKMKYWEVNDPLAAGVVFALRFVRTFHRMSAEIDENGKMSLSPGGDIKVIRSFDMELFRKLIENSVKSDIGIRQKPKLLKLRPFWQPIPRDFNKHSISYLKDVIV